MAAVKTQQSATGASGDGAAYDLEVGSALAPSPVRAILVWMSLLQWPVVLDRAGGHPMADEPFQARAIQPRWWASYSRLSTLIWPAIAVTRIVVGRH